MPVRHNRPGPLGDKDKLAIDTALRGIHDVQEAFARAEACGIDCQEHRSAAAGYVNLLTQMKQQYFPGEP